MKKFLMALAALALGVTTIAGCASHSEEITKEEITTQNNQVWIDNTKEMIEAINTATATLDEAVTAGVSENDLIGIQVMIGLAGEYSQDAPKDAWTQADYDEASILANNIINGLNVESEKLQQLIP